MKEYIEVWNSSFKLGESLSRNNYWAFVCLNFLCLVIIFQIITIFEIDYLFQIFMILFIFSSFSAGVRRMNDIKKPWFYLFIPFYNFILLIERSIEENEIQSSTSQISSYSFLLILLYSIIIGVINLLLPALIYKDNEISMYFVLIISAYSASISLLSFMILALADIFLKNKFTNYNLLIYFMILLLVSVITQFMFIKPEN